DDDCTAWSFLDLVRTRGAARDAARGRGAAAQSRSRALRLVPVAEPALAAGLGGDGQVLRHRGLPRHRLSRGRRLLRGADRRALPRRPRPVLASRAAARYRRAHGESDRGRRRLLARRRGVLLRARPGDLTPGLEPILPWSQFPLFADL